MNWPDFESRPTSNVFLSLDMVISSCIEKMRGPNRPSQFLQLLGVTGRAAVVAAVDLVVVPLSLSHGRFAARKIAKIDAVFRSRHEAAAGHMNFMIAVRLGVLIHVVVSHRTLSFLLHHIDARDVVVA